MLANDISNSQTLKHYLIKLKLVQLLTHFFDTESHLEISGSSSAYVEDSSSGDFFFYLFDSDPHARCMSVV